MWFFWETAKGSKFTVECNWISKISQKFENLRFLTKKIDGFFGKLGNFFYKLAYGSQVALKGHWRSKTSQNVQKFGVCQKNGWVFPKNIIPFSQKIDKGSKFAVECDSIS